MVYGGCSYQCCILFAMAYNISGGGMRDSVVAFVPQFKNRWCGYELLSATPLRGLSHAFCLLTTCHVLTNFFSMCFVGIP